MQLYIKGSGPLSLSKRNFVAQGGQGSVYTKNKKAYKIYSNQSNMIPLGKFQELSAIEYKNILIPLEIILNNNHEPVGYSMRFIKDTYILCQLFTKAFRNREGVSHEIVQKLIKQLRDMIEHIHSKNILIVDLNEMNFLVNKSFDEIYAIDTDSYQTKSFPATVIMESIRDRHSKKFTKETDWFSFGIIAFQMFAGIHPYKGRHSNIKTLDERMIQNISVLNPAVSVPGACYNFDVIPESYRQWFYAIFETGKRVAPPIDFQLIANVTSNIERIFGSDNFEITEIFNAVGDILSIAFTGGKRIIYTGNNIHVNNRTFKTSTGLKIILSPKTETPILCKLVYNELKLFNAETQEDIACQIYGSQLMVYNNTLYIKNSSNILKLELHEIGEKIIVGTKVVANIFENATRIFDGVIVQNLLDALYVSIFPNDKLHYQIRIKELEDYQIVDGKFDNDILMLVGYKKGIYDGFIIKLNNDHYSYNIIKKEKISHTGFNFITLDSGICVSINSNDEIEIFSNKSNNNKIKIINDPIISGMKLFKDNNRVMFSKGNKLCLMKMKI